eukprot:3233069-Pleurochrysis_carterae.AAC.1
MASAWAKLAWRYDRPHAPAYVRDAHADTAKQQALSQVRAPSLKTTLKCLQLFTQLVIFLYEDSSLAVSAGIEDCGLCSRA